MVENTLFSRYVALIRWFYRGEAVADVVCDTTDIRRDGAPYAPILAILLFNDDSVEAARDCASGLIDPELFF